MSLRGTRLGYNEGFFALSKLYAYARQFAIERASRFPLLGPKIIELALRRKYGARVITPVKVQNFIQANRDEASKAIAVDSVPYHLNLDLYNVCNLRCRFCPTGTNQLDRLKSRLPVDKAKEIIDAVKEYIITFSPYHWGEPLLNPDTFEIIRYAHDVGTYTQIHSNLSLKVSDLGSRLVESGLDNLLVSVDGVEQSVNEGYRRRVNNDFVFANIQDIVEARRKARSKTPRIEVAFLVFRHNEHEIPLLEAKRKELGVDECITRKAAIYDERWIPKSSDFQPLQQLFTETCSFLYTDLNVEPDGGISPCCINSSKKWDVGNADELKDLHAFWNNATHQAMRAYHANFGTNDGDAGGAGKDILCRHCNWVAECRSQTDFGKLSPLPPALAAEGVSFEHGIAADALASVLK